jgi:hypothetical protein
MPSSKKLKKSDSAQRALGWFHDNPGAKVASVAKRFGISLPYAYKLREKAAGNAEVAAPTWREKMDKPLLTNAEVDALFGGHDSRTKGLDNILDTRASDYGTFGDNARLAQALKRAMAEHAEDHGRTFTDDQWEALEMIATKMSRIVNGNPNKADSWDDIAGYAKLVSDRIQGRVR